MKIGIFVTNSKSIFINGCLQQGYFLMKSFRAKGYECKFVSVENDFNKFELIDEDVHVIKSTVDLDYYNLLVFSSGSVNDNSYLSYCKMKGISIVSLCVGNYYIINQEELILDAHKDNNVLSRMNSYFIDESWLMPMYKHNINYMKFISNRNINLSPYVWDSTFIDLYIKTNNLSITYKPNKEQLDVLIMEPNLSIHKSCLVPLLICEQFYRLYPHKLGKIYLFCKPNTSRFSELNYLSIIKYEKVEYYDRVISMSLFDSLTKLSKKFVVLSSNIRNGLNFLHLECFKLGIPIIHNCKPFSDSGLYYEESDNYDDYPLAVEHLNSVYNCNYNQNTKRILDKYDPHCNENINNYDILVKNAIQGKYDLITNLKNNIRTNYLNNDSYDKKLAIVFIDTSNNLEIIKLNIKNIIQKMDIEYKLYLVSENNYKEFDTIISKDITKAYLDIYRKIKHTNMILIDSSVLLEFDISQMLKSVDLLGIEMISGKELYHKDYEYYSSYIKIIKKIFKNNDSIKLYNPKFCYIRNSLNIKNFLTDIPNLDYLDNILIFNLVNNIFYNNLVNIDNKKILMNSDTGYCGYIYTNIDNSKLISVYKNILAKNKSVTDSDKLYLAN